MAEILTREDHNGSRGGSSVLATIALMIAIAALVLAWAAYNRAGEDLENQIGQGVEQTSDNIQEGSREAGESVQDGTDAVERGIDTGPDGVDDGAR